MLYGIRRGTPTVRASMGEVRKSLCNEKTKKSVRKRRTCRIEENTDRWSGSGRAKLNRDLEQSSVNLNFCRKSVWFVWRASDKGGGNSKKGSVRGGGCGRGG